MSRITVAIITVCMDDRCCDLPQRMDTHAVTSRAYTTDAARALTDTSRSDGPAGVVSRAFAQNEIIDPLPDEQHLYDDAL